jgi:YegS/Rv2252/BmrU family lipid kinase
MKIALIANSRSSGVSEENLLPELENKFKKHHIAFELLRTQYHDHATQLVKQISMREYDAIVSMGGDGTNFQVLNSVLKYHGDSEIPPLGILPCGRGNSFARDLQLFSAEDGIDALRRQTTRAVDVCQFSQNQTTHYFVNLMGFGFVTDVAKTAARFKWAADFSYVIGVFYRLMGLAFHQMTLEIDGEVISGQNCFVEICNSKYTGGNMLMAPEAAIDDGLFDAVVVSPLSRASLIATFPKIFKGTHGQNPAVKFIKGKSAAVYTEPQKSLLPDGEIFGATPTEITILPRLVKYFV